MEAIRLAVKEIGPTMEAIRLAMQEAGRPWGAASQRTPLLGKC
jgi:hypothetical protein